MSDLYVVYKAKLFRQKIREGSGAEVKSKNREGRLFWRSMLYCAELGAFAAKVRNLWIYAEKLDSG